MRVSLSDHRNERRVQSWQSALQRHLEAPDADAVLPALVTRLKYARDADVKGWIEGSVQRLAAGDDDNSYTASLARAGMSRIAQKIGEEGVELALAAATDRDQDELLGEAADLFYHVLVMLRVKSLSVADVTKVLEARHAGAR